MKKLTTLIVILLVLGFMLLLNYLEYITLFPRTSDKPTVLLPTVFQKMKSETKSSASLTIKPFVENLEVPWSIVFTSENRMLVTERPGRIRIIENGRLATTPLATFLEVSSNAEEGLMGMTLHPKYATNKQVYICFAYEKGGRLVDKVEQFTDNETSVTGRKTIIDNIPAAEFHAGCRIKFGPDGKLYITTGDATDREQAQNRNSLAGKILRLNEDGSVPADNPFSGSPIWTLGHRNPQGIDWHPATETMFETEHGPTGGDEVNIIKKGGNYGWPTVSHERTDPGFVSPKLVFTPAEAPASALFYDSDVIPQFKNNLFFGALRGEGIMRIILSEDNSEEIVSYEKLKEINFGRIREVMQGPEGAIYFTTSNRDGRGTVRNGDDKIYRIVSSR